MADVTINLLCVFGTNSSFAFLFQVFLSCSSHNKVRLKARANTSVYFCLLGFHSYCCDKFVFVVF